MLTRWRRERLLPSTTPVNGRPEASQEQQEILRLRKELRQAEMERDILDPMLTHVCWSKKAVSIFSRNDGTFFSS
jgi:transposase